MQNKNPPLKTGRHYQLSFKQTKKTKNYKLFILFHLCINNRFPYQTQKANRNAFFVAVTNIHTNTVCLFLFMFNTLNKFRHTLRNV